MYSFTWFWRQRVTSWSLHTSLQVTDVPEHRAFSPCWSGEHIQDFWGLGQLRVEASEYMDRRGWGIQGKEDEMLIKCNQWHLIIQIQNGSFQKNLFLQCVTDTSSDRATFPTPHTFLKYSCTSFSCSQTSISVGLSLYWLTDGFTIHSIF